MLAFNVTSQPTRPVYLDRDEGQKISFFARCISGVFSYDFDLFSFFPVFKDPL